MRALVTGGAGYVGSHLVAMLVNRGDTVVVLDDLRQGHRAAVPAGVRLVQTNIDSPLALATLAEGWDVVFHFAALSLVGESMAEPLRYLNENTGSGLRLIAGCIQHGIRRFVLSSTANVFGEPATVPIGEDAAMAPSSPYGESKLMLERALFWAQRQGLHSASLRYFNAAGADPDGRLGEDHRPETHLIPLVIDAALGRRGPLDIFGTDYPTPDGTCVRDYVHVSDLAAAHLGAASLLDGRNVTFNVGIGQGHSVRDVIRSVERVLGRPVPMRELGRRPGDPAVLVASAGLLREQTGWVPRYPDLDTMVAHAAAWRVANPHGYRLD